MTGINKNWKVFSMNSLGEFDFVPEYRQKSRIGFGSTAIKKKRRRKEENWVLCF